ENFAHPLLDHVVGNAFDHFFTVDRPDIRPFASGTLEAEGPRVARLPDGHRHRYHCNPGDDAGLSSAGAPVPALSGKRARRFAISSAGGRWPGASAPPHRMAAWAPRRWVTIVRTASVWLMPRTRIRISTAFALASSSRSSCARRSSAIDGPDSGSCPRT